MDGGSINNKDKGIRAPQKRPFRHRISRLQKWILDRMIENGKKREVRPYIYREEIYRDFYGFQKKDRWDKYPHKMAVAISHSLNLLESRGFIKRIYGRPKVYLFPESFSGKSSLLYISQINKKADDASATSKKRRA